MEKKQSETSDTIALFSVLLCLRNAHGKLDGYKISVVYNYIKKIVEIFLDIEEMFAKHYCDITVNPSLVYSWRFELYHISFLLSFKHEL